jgi:DNA-binding CsgD family transcriptional regulator
MNSKPKRLQAREVCGIFRLLGEIRELGSHPDAWRNHLARNLRLLIDYKICVCAEQFLSPENPDETYLVGMIDWGWTGDESKSFYQYLSDGDIARDPLHKATLRLSHRAFTRRRRDLVADESWYSSPTTMHARRGADIDDLIYSRCPVYVQNWGNVICLHRAWGDEPFSQRDRLIVSLLHRELGRIWRMGVGQGPELTPRLRQTLELTSQGFSEKEMAQRLGLSAHTVHDFLRRLYRQFGVTNRGELLAHPNCRPVQFRPALSIFADESDE